MGCNYILTFRKNLKNIVYDISQNQTGGQSDLTPVTDFLKTVKDQVSSSMGIDIKTDANLLEQLVKITQSALSDKGISGLNEINISAVILGVQQNIKQEQPATTVSLDIETKQRSEYRRDFVDRIYYGADNVKNFALKQSDVLFNEAIFCNRENCTITKNDQDLNRNIRTIQEKMFQTVKDYLNKRISKENRNAEADFSVLDNNLTLYDNNGNYTGAFEKLFGIAKYIFDSFDKTTLLREYLRKTEALKAFISFQTLLHFDEFIVNSLGKNIKVYDMDNRFSSENKYSLSARASSMFWTNGDNDDIDVEKSINNLSRLIVETSRMYDFNTGDSIPDTYISFSQYVLAITKLKDLSWKQYLTRTIKLQEKTPTGKLLISLNNLSDESRRYIESLGENATIATLINKTRTNPRRAFSTLFELLYECRNDTVITNIWNTFNSEEKNILCSLYKEIFGIKSNRSIRHIQDINGYIERNIFGTILQTSDSIWMVKNCQYYQDIDKEQIILRTLQNSAVDRIKFQLNDLFNLKNSPKVNDAYIQYKAYYDSKTGFAFTYKGHKILLKNSGAMTIDGKNFINYANGKFKETQEEFIELLDNMLHLNLEYSRDILNNYYHVKGKDNELTSLESLIKFSAELLHGQYAINEIDKEYENNENTINDTQESKKQFIEQNYSKYFAKEYYGEATVKFKYKNIDIVPKKMLDVLRALSSAKAITDGVFTLSQTNDSEGKALSNSTPSRLLSAFQCQFEDIRNDQEAPANNLAIVSDPRTLLDIQTVREFKSKSEKSKIYKDFNTREFLESSLLYDFIYPLIDQKADFNLPKDGAIAITPSVNSDKNTISKMLINLAYELTKMGYKDIPGKESSIQSFLFDTSYTNLYDYINNQLGNFYLKIIDNIQKELDKLSNSETFRKVLGENYRLIYNPNNYLELNQKLAEYNTLNPEKQYTIRELFDEASRETGAILNEQLHTVFVKDQNDNQVVTVNGALLSLCYRHTGKYHNVLGKNPIDGYTFWKYKDSELLQSFINNKIEIDVVENKELFKFLKSIKWPVGESWNGIDEGVSTLLDEWVDSSGKLMLAKIHIGDRIIPITSEKDLLEIHSYFANELNGDELKNNIHIIADQLTLNPLLKKWNMISYLYSQEFILATVGSHINHVYKGAKPLWEHTNPMQLLEEEAGRFQAQHKRNVSFTASMHEFLLDDLKGIPSEYNTACIEDINDLVYNIFGVTEKVKPFDGATIVNPYIVHLENNSLHGEKAGIHKKQYIHSYNIKTGTGYMVKTAGFGITNYWMRNSKLLQDMNQNMTDVQWKDEKGQTMYVDITKSIQGVLDNPKYKMKYKIYHVIPQKINKKWVNTYAEVTDIKYNGEGKYTLSFKMVNDRGQVSGLLTNEEGKNEWTQEVFCDSNYKVWKYIFGGLNCASINPETGKLSNKGDYGEASILNMVEAINSCGILLSGTIPEDQSNYYQPMKHSDTHYLVTAGAIKQGASNLNTASSYYKIRPYNRFKMKANFAGIQLDKSHHADQSEISMMTQVISACAALGYSFESSSKLYKALESLAKVGVKDIADGLAEYLETNNDLKFRKEITTLLVEQLINSSKESDGLVYVIAKELIQKYRNNGTLTDEDINSNIIPFSDRVVFNKISSLLTSGLSKMAIKLQFSGTLSVLTPSHEIMKIHGDRLRSNFVNFEEEIKDLQDQETPKEIFEVEMGRTYRIMEGNNIIRTVLVKAPIMKNGIYGNPNTEYIGYYELKELMSQHSDWYLIEDIIEGRNLGAYFCTFSDGTNKYNFYDLYDSYMMYNPDKDEDIIGLDKKTANKLQRDKLQTTLKNLKEGQEVKVYVKDQDGTIKSRSIIVHDLNIKPYEIIMPKVFAQNFNLTIDDNLYDLVNNKDIFTQKILNNLSSKISDRNYYTVALKRINGNHIYLLDRKQFNKLDKSKFIRTENKDTYIVDGQQVIVTDNIAKYLNEESYNLLEVTSNLKYIHSIASKSSNKSARKWAELVEEGGNFAYNNDNINNINLQGNTPQSIKNMIIELGNEVYTSFKKSLDIIAARIPAQSMQSFMPMKVVAYEDLDINNAYVSTHQIWLQGSDYDIDCVSLLTYNIDLSGRFVGWSPYFDISTEQNFTQSTEFDYPTGEKVKKVDEMKVVDSILEMKINEESDEDPDELIEYLRELGIEDVNIQTYKDAKRFNAILNYSDVYGLDGYKWAAQQYNKYDKDFITKILKEYVNILINPFNIINNKDNISLTIKSLPDLIKFINFISRNGLLDIENSKILSRIAESINLETINNYKGIKSLFKALETIVNNHNDYINSKKAESFTKNYIVEQMFRISTDPSNLLEAQQSVDKTTEEPKSIANKSLAARNLLQNATPGNIGNIFQSIEDNHVGKDVIGISALGLKGFFAQTQYINTILNGTDYEKIDQLLRQPPLIFNGKEYYLIANANSLNTDILRKLVELRGTEYQEDAALLLSALLSLATDNAKELCLAKLNANAKMAGMYIYGLTKGIPFDELGQLLMSDIGGVISQYLKGSIITDQFEFENVAQVIQYLRNPQKIIRDIYRSKKMWAQKTGLKSNESVWAHFNKIFMNKTGNSYSYAEGKIQELVNQGYTDYIALNDFLKLYKKNINDYGGPLGFIRYAIEYINNPNNIYPLSPMDIVTFFNFFKQIPSGSIPQNAYLINQLIDTIQDAFISINKIKKAEKSLWPGAFDDFIKLYEGAEEMRAMGQLAGFNKGLKATNADFLKQINSVEETLKSRQKVSKISNTSNIKKKQERINFNDFISNETYRKEIIEKYNNIKFDFNILDVISTVPNYKGYFYAANIAHAAKMRMIRYRTLYENLSRLQDLVGTMNLDNAIKAIDKLISFKLINNYLLETNQSFIIPKDNTIISVNEEITGISTDTTGKTTKSTEIFLGTQGGNATFKKFFEDVIIKDLQQGIVAYKGKIKNPYIANNKFIKSLTPNLYTFNPSKNESISYKPNINMSPTTQDGKDTLSRMRQYFNELNGSYTIEGKEYPIKDLFYLYNLITYNDQPGEGSLTSIFDDYKETSSLYEEYKNSIYRMDQGNKILNISDNELISWGAQISSPFSSSNKYIYYKDENIFETRLMSQIPDEVDKNSVARVGFYMYDGRVNKINWDYVLHYPLNGDITTIDIKDTSWKVDYNPVTKKVLKIYTNGREITENLNNGLILYDPNIQKYKLNMDIIDQIIKQKDC